MVIYLYRWKLKTGEESKFLQAWSFITKEILENSGSYGSRLHQGNEGLWYSYAQWPSVEWREPQRGKLNSDEVKQARRQMANAIEDELPEIILNPKSDFLVMPNPQ